MRIVECKQGGHDWFMARCGRVTASEMADAIDLNVKGVLAGITSAKRETLKAFLIGEILTGEPDMMGYVSKYMERGTELEPEAREYYEERNEVMVQPVGFVIHPTNDRSGASPDGLIGEDGGLEIKVPGIAKHVEYLDTPGLLPKEYEPQVMWNLACTGRAWWDFVSYCPTMSPEMRLFTVRVYASGKRIAEMEDGLDRFLSETDARIEKLRALYPPLPYRKPPPAEDYGEEGLTEDDLAYLDAPAPQHTEEDNA
jgi:putative phage-type endonuclease